MRRTPFILFVIGFAVVGCQPELGPEHKEVSFFDLSDFIQEYRATSDSLADVRKSITVDGEQELKELKDYPVHRDIIGFDGLDINKAALWDRYKVDTIRQGAGNFQIKYTALEQDLSVQSLAIDYQAYEVVAIEVRKEHHTFLADVSTYFKWTPKEGYLITKEEDQIFSDPTKHEIRVDLR